ncbi:hypothetical protein [Halobacillus sp. BBL2006]|uniref:hypothetical protein n=1 Tax=Halobacillus sp. BBL2006 TaxID=1543706 RepID=UPI00068B7E2F|nr:hypothetical protein [Halobacillus sp. BBL2006]
MSVLFISDSQDELEPPSPSVVSERGAKIPTTQGSYCWEGSTSAQCVDKVYANPLEMAEQHKPTKVSPNEEIKITFEKEPIDGSLTVEKWVDENRNKEIELENDALVAPKEKGVHYYYVKANWEKGDGNYAFSIEVK